MPELAAKPLSYLESAADSAAQHDALLNEVRKHYVFPADSRVLDFLASHWAIAQI